MLYFKFSQNFKDLKTVEESTVTLFENVSSSDKRTAKVIFDVFTLGDLTITSFVLVVL